MAENINPGSTQNAGFHKNSNKKKEKFAIEKFLFEFFSIVVGVLLALGLNQWRENRQDIKRAEVALEKILNEVISNRKLIGIVHENNLKTLQEIENIAKSDTSLRNSFIPALQISSNAWNAMLSTGISDFIDYEIINQLSELYSVQEVYLRVGYILFETELNIAAIAIGENTIVDEVMMVTKLKDYFQLIVQLEETILELLEEAVPDLQKHLE